MSRHRLPRILLGVLFFVRAANGQVTPKLISGPDQFEFTSGAYFVSQGTTNALIMVRFTPGNPSWSGAVNYSTTNGTAIPNQDYSPVSGTLYFSGVTYLSFSVPLVPHPGDEKKNLGLVLSPSPVDASAHVLGGSAVLYLAVPPPPKLDISAGPSGTVSVSWLDDGTGPVLEKRTSVGTNWTVVGVWPTLANGRMTVSDSASTSMAFYRLHRSQ
jgi:hypothetical protein